MMIKSKRQISVRAPGLLAVTVARICLCNRPNDFRVEIALLPLYWHAV